MKDPYEVLGISRNANKEEISKAYKRLAKKYHPDLNPGDEEAARKMSEINEAYDKIRKGDVGPSHHPYSSYPGYGNETPYPPGGNGQWHQQGPYTWYYVRRESPRRQQTVRRSGGCAGGCFRILLFYWILALVLILLISSAIRTRMYRYNQYNEDAGNGTVVSEDGRNIQQVYINRLEGWMIP